MFVIFYFLLIRPQQKRQKNVQTMQREIKEGIRLLQLVAFMESWMQSMRIEL